MKLRVGVTTALLALGAAAIVLVAGFAGWDVPFWWWNETTATPPAAVMVSVPAPIDDVALEYHPDGSYLVVTSGLRNGCESFKGYDVRYQNGVIQVLMENTTPFGPSVVCAEVYGKVTTRIPLGEVQGLGSIVPCQAYQMTANGRPLKVRASGNDAECPTSDGGGIALGKPFTVGFGQQAAIPGTGLSVLFRDVLEDSRCPTEAVCVWAGRARIQVSVGLNGMRIADMGLSLQDGNGGGTTSVNGYALRLIALEPHPTYGSIDKNAYTATLVVDKAPTA